MPRTDLSEDGAVLVATLTSPGRALDAVVSRRRSLVALLAATAASVLVALVTVPRIDFTKGSMVGRGPEAAALTEHQLEEAQAQAAKLGAISGYAAAGLGPAFAVLGTALACWLAFRVAGTRPGLKATVAVAAHAFLPLFLSRLLALPAVILKAPLSLADLPTLLPSSAAALLPASAPPAALAAASSVDLFALWAAVLLVLGMARVSGATLRRSGAVVAVLWLAQVAFLKVAPAAMAAAAMATATKGGA